MKPFDAQGKFQATSGEKGLRRAAVRGAGATIFAGGMAFAVQMAATLVLARLLTPADFGVVTMVTTFSLLVCSFGLNGFTEAILQRDEVTDGLASNLFWINVGTAIFLMGAFAAAGPLLARFYHDPLVARVTVGMSLTVLVSSFSVIHLALLNRAMRFSAVSVNSVVSRIVSVIVSIVMALTGFHYWSLVGGYVAQQLSTAIGAWILCQWLPGRPSSAPGTGASIKFALNVYSHYAFSYFSGNTDNLLVGWKFGAQALGFYKKAFDLFYLPANQLTSPISAVVIASLSRSNRDRAQYQRYFLSGISFLAFIGMGIGADFTLVGRDLIRIILGPGWDATGWIFLFFGPGIGVMLLYGTHGWIHLSIGRPDRWFRWGVFEFLCTVSLFLLGLGWGPPGVALAWTTSYFVLMIPAFWYAGQPIGLSLRVLLDAVWRFFVASAAALLLSAWIVHRTPAFALSGIAASFARVTTHSLLFAALYLTAVIILHGGSEPLRQTARLVKELLPKRPAAEVVSVGAPADS